MTERVRCCIPFCRRTKTVPAGDFIDEWICDPCWRTAPARLRDAYARADSSDESGVIRAWQRVRRFIAERTARAAT